MKIIVLNPSYQESLRFNLEKYYIRSGSRWPHSGVKLKGTRPHYLPFPFSLAYSAALLRQASFQVQVIDAVAADISTELLLEKIANINPAVIFYEFTALTFKQDMLLAGKIKEACNPVIIVGGPHASVFSNQILGENKAVDFIIKGEYEYALLELVQSIAQGGGNFPPGVSCRKNGSILDQGYALPIEPLDKLPLPARDIFPTNDYPDPTVYWDGFFQHRRVIQIQSSRGCIYNCYFCLWKQVFYRASPPRFFSAFRVVQEIRAIADKYQVQEIYFDDDDFTSSRQNIAALCRELKKSRLAVKWSCMGSVDNLSEDILSLMSESGCIGIKFGIESASIKVLQRIGKPVNLAKVKEVIDYCAKLKIKTQATFLIGLLGETPGDIKETTSFANALSADNIQVSIATPFPGTEFFDELQKQNCSPQETSGREYNGKNYKPPDYFLNLGIARKKFFAGWLARKLFSPAWYFKHFYVIIRTIKGAGLFFLLTKVLAAITDEINNK
jgi:anaerobic magnesium-protoporphyrin IX monomethyl ester cyclase